MATLLSAFRPGSRASYAADADLVARSVVASALIGSAVVHGTVAGEHFAQWVPAGLFFVALQVVELALALLAIYAWTRRAARLVVLTGVGTLGVWLLSRTAGMPFGPPSFRAPEAVGVPDAVCGLLELMSVVAALVALPLLDRPAAPLGRPRPAGTRRGVVLAGAVVWASVVLTVGGGAATVLDPHAHTHVAAPTVP